MDRHELARIFNEIGNLLELKGENPFKTRAYYNAARAVENLGEDLDDLIQEGRLREVSGFGEAIERKVLEWKNTGTIEYHEHLKETIPPGLIELLRLPGLGPRKVSQLYSSLGVSDLTMLEEACRENKLLNLPGFGVKTQERICAGLDFLKAHEGSFLWAEGMEWALKMQRVLSAHPMVSRVEIAGSLRRRKPVCKDIDLVAAAVASDVLMEYFTGADLCQDLGMAVEEVSSKGKTKSSIRLKNGISIDLRVVKPEEFPHAVQHFTGSKEHNTALRSLAKTLGYKVNEYGLFKGKERRYCRDETELYQSLGLAYIPPELREGLGEIKAATSGNLPRLVEAHDLRGLFHVHTTYSDGVNTIRELVRAAINNGYNYLGLADHSQSAVYAHGLSREALERQFAEVDQVNEEHPNFKVFKGIEADILPSGDLDYDIQTLAKFDFVIGSVHSHFQMGEKEMTKRILRAMDNPYLTMVGHPTGRILLGRPPYKVDLAAVLAKAAEIGVIMEFNANPYRLDLDWQWCRQAKKQGVKVAINPDAHSIQELELARSGVLVARKGWLEKEDVFNTQTTQEIEDYFRA